MGPFPHAKFDADGEGVNMGAPSLNIWENCCFGNFSAGHLVQITVRTYTHVRSFALHGPLMWSVIIIIIIITTRQKLALVMHF